MKYFIIAGEQSGDLHGSNLIREIIKKDRDASIECWGGDQMESAGARLLVHYRQTAFMGFVEVARNLGNIKRNLALCKKQIESYKPDVVILIDYPGFNFRIAEFAKKSGYTVFYYISPKLWAWNEKRVEKVRMFVDRMYIIFPFEVDFYRKHNIEVEYLGNPLLDETEKKLRSFPTVDQVRESLGLKEKPVIAIMAGSRRSEVKNILPGMVRISEYFKGYQFVLAGVNTIPDDLYKSIINGRNVKLIKERTYEILYVAEAALVKSGTGTLETALFNVPQVVCFRADILSMLIARAVIRVRFISLVNLITGYEAVKELIQFGMNPKSLSKELRAVLPGGEKRNKILGDYKKIREILGPEGASERIAADIVERMAGVDNKHKTDKVM